MPTPSYQAFLFDMNGTMIDDMDFHTEAWHQILTQDLEGSFSREEVKAQMYGKNSEVLARFFGEGRFTQEEADRLSVQKEKIYQKEYISHLRLIKGLDVFLKKAAENKIQMAIATAAITFNIDFVVDNLHLRPYFQALISADDVNKSKPHPETFLKAAEQLGVDPKNCLVFEDAPKGVEAALNAGMDCLVITTMHGPEEFAAYDNIIGFVQDYTDPLLEKLFPGGQK
ncbi:HAD family hydrolase [Rufibacter glacialis]|uniref:Beta-phosphoglucomutase n=1 Tax=Rufibacter glacialis TaxID=1259555 RepID=A0A5M8QM57_9BACT|nr:HAD family phosphatase [Rufibacter glacialis]KAA6437169.1 HAD family phosphatase [Rufibacter glacialis]GGK61544.1 beta-phosphoglucomutase [Rufibacter glacialis]